MTARFDELVTIVQHFVQAELKTVNPSRKHRRVNLRTWRYDHLDRALGERET